MTIEEILKQGVNKNVYGTFTVKTAKKLWEDSDGWIHQVCLTDSTGDMLADFHVITYSPIQRGIQVELILAMTQHSGDKDVRLYVEEWKQSGEPISEPPEIYMGDTKVVKSKIMCRHSEAFIVKYGTGIDENGWDVLDFIESKMMEEIVEKILK